MRNSHLASIRKTATLVFPRITGSCWYPQGGRYGELARESAHIPGCTMGAVTGEHQEGKPAYRETLELKTLWPHSIRTAKIEFAQRGKAFQLCQVGPVRPKVQRLRSENRSEINLTRIVCEMFMLQTGLIICRRSRKMVRKVPLN